MLQGLFYQGFTSPKEKYCKMITLNFVKLETCMAMQKSLADFFLFKEFLSFFKKFVLGDISFINRHLLILNGHNNHIIL